MSEPAGEITIGIRRRDGAVTIASTRPVRGAGAFADKPVGEVLQGLPLVYSVCATAQTLAGVRACESALGRSPTEGTAALRNLLLVAETAKEHLWRLLLDWPRALVPFESGVRSDEPALGVALRTFLGVRRGLAGAADPLALSPGPTEPVPAAPAPHLAGAPLAALVTLAESRVLRMPPLQWLSRIRDADALQAWATRTDSGPALLTRAIVRAGVADLGRNPVPPLRLRSRVQPLEQVFIALGRGDADAFVAAPHLDCVSHETTPLVRETERGGALVADLVRAHGNGLLARFGALLVELARAAAEIDACIAARPIPAEAAWRDADAPDSLNVVEAHEVDPIDGPRRAVPRVGDRPQGAALGLADAARGLLAHRVDMQGMTVRRYRIVAPTEWNFQPRGVVAKGLEAIAAGLSSRAKASELEALARLYITSVDPCVAYRLEVD